MGWDIYIHCNGIKFDEASWSYTHNTNAMMSRAGYDWVYSLDQANVLETLPHFRAMLKNLKSEPEIYRAINPPNGWGNYDELVEMIEALIARATEIAERVPNAQWREWS